MILAFLHIGGNSDNFSACVVGEEHTTTAGCGNSIGLVLYSTIGTPTKAKNIFVFITCKQVNPVYNSIGDKVELLVILKFILMTHTLINIKVF